MYITTPIYYVNDKPHLGHAYTTFAADILARWGRLAGRKVFFLTGTDENSQKNVEAAYTSGTRDIKKYLDQMSACWQNTWDSLNITNDDFIRTTEERHKKGVEEFFLKVEENGDIYRGKYEGLYCSGCEAFLTPSDLVGGECPFHKRAPDKIKEENYFFRASRYRGEILDHIKKHPEFIQPDSRRNEVINYLEDHFTDVSISRPRSRRGKPRSRRGKWGIPLPIDKTQVIYVWFDALLNYLTAVGYGEDKKKFQEFWPADIHLMAKDIIKFHCALWPAMLLSAGLPLPRKIFAHGFFTINGEKISKSLGNAVDPIELSQDFGLDSLRYFLFREIVFGQDGDFSLKRFKERYQSDLANGLGNLVSRVLSLAESWGEKLKIKDLPRPCGDLSRTSSVMRGASGDLPREEKLISQEESISSKGFEELVAKSWENYERALEELAFCEALDEIWELISFCDGYIEKTKPWELKKSNEEKLEEVLVNLLETLRHIGVMLWPFMPETAEKILDQLGVLERERKRALSEIKLWQGAQGIKVKKKEILFPRW